MYNSSSRLRAQANSTVFFMLQQRSVPATKRQATKCTRDEVAGDELAGNEVYPRRNGSDETSCSAHSRLFSGLVVAGTVNICCTKQSGPYQCCCRTLASGHRLQLHCRLFVISVSIHAVKNGLQNCMIEQFWACCTPSFHQSIHEWVVCCNRPFPYRT